MLIPSSRRCARREPRPASLVILVYMVVCRSNGKQYFGITKETLHRRRQRHLTTARRGSKYRFHQALRKYGPTGFLWVKLGFTDTWDEACEAEKFLIQTFGTMELGYNSTRGGEGSYGMSLSEESRSKISFKLKQWHASDDPAAAALREKVSQVRINSVASEETRKRMSLAHKGKRTRRKQFGQ